MNKNSRVSVKNSGSGGALPMAEGAIQSAVHLWLWNSYPHTRGLAFHIPNGGKRDPLEAARLTAQGVVPGIPDYFIAIPFTHQGCQFHGIFIEFKTPTANLNTEHHATQLKRQEALKNQNFYVCEMSDVEETKTLLRELLKLG